MILFAPAYDESTRATHQMAARFGEMASVELLGEDATRRNLVAALQSPAALVAFTHGTRGALRGQHSEEALSAPDAGMVGPRRVLAYACHTGSELGRVMAEQGATWWGYTGAIAAPPDDPAHAGLVAFPFEYLVEESLDEHDASLLPGVLDRLRGVCREAEEALDRLMETGEVVEMQSYQCLFHLWDRLRIWLPGSSVPVHHSQSSPPDLLL